MKKQIKRWTKDEDEVLIEYIKMHPNNLTYCFEKTALTLKDRSVKSVSKRYYNILKNSDRNIFGVGSSKGIVMNSKNSPRKQDTTVKQLIIKLFSKLTEEQKKQVLEKVF